MSDIPNNWGPLLRVHGVRGSQIGDAISALSVYAYLRQVAPDCHTIWQIARKHVHAAPLFYNNDLISELSISDCNEGYGPRDIAQANSCHIRLPLMPEHRPNEIWPNLRSFYAETFTMAGLDEPLYHSMSPEVRRPKLTQWFEVIKQPRTVSYWPCAAYGQPQMITMPDGSRQLRSRNASREWAVRLVQRLQMEGYRVIQCGHPNDYADCGGALGADADMRWVSFMDMIKISIGCDLSIGTDSGAGIALGAYSTNQITLLTNHYPGHITNLMAFAPDNPNNHSLVGLGSADAISIDEVMSTVKQLLS